MVAFAIWMFIVFPKLCQSQNPAKQGLEAFSIPDNNDTIHFYVSNPGKSTNPKLFLYLQGSGEMPMVSGDDENDCCYITYPKNLIKEFPKAYAFVYIQKIGLPYYVRNLKNFKPDSSFYKRNNVIDRAAVASKVVNYLLKKVYPKTKIVAVLGHSEGSDVAALLAVKNKRVTHLCFASGNGTPQIFNDVLFIRRKMARGELTASEAQNQLDSLFVGLQRVYQDPKSTTRYFNGDSYRWNYAINHPPLDNLLKLKIPLYLVAGSKDTKVPVETSDYIVAEFIRHRKSNLTYKVYLDCDHSFKEVLPNGELKDRWNELFFDFLAFIDGR